MHIAHWHMHIAHCTLTYAHSHSNFDTDNTPKLFVFANSAVVSTVFVLVSYFSRPLKIGRPNHESMLYRGRLIHETMFLHSFCRKIKSQLVVFGVCDGYPISAHNYSHTK